MAFKENSASCNSTECFVAVIREYNRRLQITTNFAGYVVKYLYILPIISTTIWGISIVGGKILSAAEFIPTEITFGRFALASLVFLPVLLLLYLRGHDILPKGRQWLYILGLAITGVAVNNTIFYSGLQYTDASVASMLVSLNPLMTMIFAVLMLGETMNMRRWISIPFGIVGVVLILGIQNLQLDDSQLIGNLLILTAVAMWGSSFSFSKKASNSGLSAILITAWSEILGTIMLIPYNLHTFPKYFSASVESLFWFVFMGIFSSVFAYIIHYKAIEVLGASVVAPSTNLIPISGAVTAVMLLQDTFTGSAIIGILLIIIGVLIVQTEKTVKPNSAETSILIS